MSVNDVHVIITCAHREQWTTVLFIVGDVGDPVVRIRRTGFSGSRPQTLTRFLQFTAKIINNSTWIGEKARILR